MKTITQFDKSTIKIVIRPEVERALEVLKQYGVVATIGTIRFSANSLRFKVEARVLGQVTSGSTQITEPVEVLDLRSFEKSHPEFGTLVNRSVNIMGKDFTVTGYSPRKPKFPFLVTGIAGGRYKVSMAQVRRAIGLSDTVFGGRR